MTLMSLSLLQTLRSFLYTLGPFPNETDDLSLLQTLRSFLYRLGPFPNETDALFLLHRLGPFPYTNEALFLWAPLNAIFLWDIKSFSYTRYWVQRFSFDTWGNVLLRQTLKEEVCLKRYEYERRVGLHNLHLLWRRGYKVIILWWATKSYFDQSKIYLNIFVTDDLLLCDRCPLALWQVPFCYKRCPFLKQS